MDYTLAIRPDLEKEVYGMTAFLELSTAAHLTINVNKNKRKLNVTEKKKDVTAVYSG